jgi:hypothetical protein
MKIARRFLIFPGFSAEYLWKDIDKKGVVWFNVSGLWV